MQFVSTVLGPFIIIIGIISGIIIGLDRLAQTYYESRYEYRVLQSSLTIFPYIIILLFLSILQITNGLGEFIDRIFWITILLFLTLSLLLAWTKRSYELLSYQVELVLWFLLFGGIKIIYSRLIKEAFIQSLLTLVSLPFMLTLPLVFMLITIPIFLIFFLTMSRASLQSQVDLVKETNFMTLIVLITYLPNSTLKLSLVTLIVFSFLYSKGRYPLDRNSINLKEKNITHILTEKVLDYRFILQKMTELSVFYIAFLII